MKRTTLCCECHQKHKSGSDAKMPLKGATQVLLLAVMLQCGGTMACSFAHSLILFHHLKKCISGHKHTTRHILWLRKTGCLHALEQAGQIILRCSEMQKDCQTAAQKCHWNETSPMRWQGSAARLAAAWTARQLNVRVLQNFVSPLANYPAKVFRNNDVQTL